MAKNLVGLDIGTSKVRAAEVSRGRGRPTIVRYAEAPLPVGAVRDGEVVNHDIVVEALRHVRTAGKFVNRDVVLGVGNQRVMVRSLELPWMPMNQLRSTLPFQVGDMLPVAVEDAVLDYYPTGGYQDEKSQRTVQGLLVAATRDTIGPNIAAAETAGWRPMQLDLNAFALTRALSLLGIQDRCVALVDIGAKTTNVVVLDHGVPRLVRVLASGGQDTTDAIAAELKIPLGDAEALKREVGLGFQVPEQYRAASDIVSHVTGGLIESIRSTFTYYAQNNPGAAPDLVLLTGGGSYLNGLGQYLSSASRLTVSLVDFGSAVTVSKSANVAPLKGAETTIAIPLGLALAERS